MLLIAAVATAVLLTSVDDSAPLRVYASPAPVPIADGSREHPWTMEQAFDHLSNQLSESGVPAGGVELILLDGRYRVDHSITPGPEFAGTPNRKISIRSIDDAGVIIDGSVSLDSGSFAPVTDPDERALLAESAADQIVATTVKDPRLVETLSRSVMLNLSIDGSYFLPSVFPNEGFARLNNKVVEPEACPPGISPEDRGYGIRAGTLENREEGKPAGWKGSISEPRGAWATIAVGRDEMAGSWQQWADELERDPTRHEAPGFLEADWLLSSIPFVEADPQREALHLSRVLSYGWNWRKTKEFRVFGLLCELDRPGEWHFDPGSRRLYLFPPKPLAEISEISVPILDSLFKLDGCTHVEIRGLHITNLASGWAFEIGGSDNRVAACSVRNATAGGALIEGMNNTVSGCDFVDLKRHVLLAGGRRNPNEIVPGKNAVENCHFYQRQFGHLKVGISIDGVGNLFRHNLVHNSLGQAITVHGNDHLIELNELFNIGYAEGDGGAIYAGADLTGYGTTYRYNFIHHLMCVPGKVGRHGIHLDDFQAGAICIGNVFYKSASQAIGMNHGAGHRIINNVFLNGRIGPLNRGVGSQSTMVHAVAIANDPNSPQKASKEDYLGRAQAITGKDGWTRPPWSEHFPLMNKVLSDEGEFGRFWPIRCEIRNNFYYGNTYNHMIWDRTAPEARAKSVVEGETLIEPEAFADYENLDLRLSDQAPDLLRQAGIPFDQIGLFLGPDRAAMPDKTHYRRAIREFFEGIPSSPGTDRKIDTGALVETGPIIRRSKPSTDGKRRMHQP